MLLTTQIRRFSKCAFLQGVQLSSQLRVHGHICSTSPMLLAGAASLSLSPSLPSAAGDSRSPLHAVPTSPCPNHSHPPTPPRLCALHAGVTQTNTATKLALALHGWPHLLHPPPDSHAGVVSTCTKISFCEAAGLFTAAISLSLPSDPAVPGDEGALGDALSAPDLCQPASLPMHR